MATLTDNTIAANNRHGVSIRVDATATVAGGEINQNTQDGIFMERMSSADIALTGNPLTIADNEGAGIFIADDGSSARIDRARITFRNNAEGEIIGPFMAP